METPEEARARRANWEIPKHGRFQQCYFCGHLANGHARVGTRYVPVCGHRHNQEGKRITG